MLAAPVILVVDDEELIRSLLAEALESAGYQVKQAENGIQALRIQRSTPAQVIITDLVMPEREGIETIEQFRRDYPEVKIIAISGAFDGRFLLVAQKLGASSVLQKPVDPDVVVKTVGRLIGA